jgi:uncharacterized protein (DUF362 family)
LKTVEIPDTILKSNYFISVAKLKTSVQQKITCILKNQFGCIPGNKGNYHPWLSQTIVDINYTLKPDLCIIDGIHAMEGNGPIDGTPKRMDLIIAGKNYVATDTVAARIMMINPKNVPHLKRASKRGLGKMKDIELVGENLNEVRESFKCFPIYGNIPLKIGDSIKRNADRLKKLGEVAYLAGFFLSDVKKFSSALSGLSMSEIRKQIRERTGSG